MKFCLKGLACSLLILTAGCNDSRFLSSIPLAEPHIKSRADGIYRGSYRLKLPLGTWIAYPEITVDVTLSNGRYQSFRIINKPLLNQEKGMKDVMVRMEQEQKIGLDGVTGASYTIKALQKAVENALR